MMYAAQMAGGACSFLSEWAGSCFSPVPVQSSMAYNGYNVLIAQVLRAAGIEYPRAIAVVFSARQGSVNAVKHLHEAFPDVGPATYHIFSL